MPGRNDLGRRTSVENAGPAFSQTEFNLFGYNDRSELTSSHRYNDTYPNENYEVTAEKRLFDYDLIGNREDMTADSAMTYYCVNDLNQYDKTSGSDDCPTPTSPIDTFEYDKDGNLTGDDKFDFTWNAENRLIRISPSSPTTGDKTVQFMYDYMGRRAAKYVWTYDGSTWSHTNTAKFIYDDWNVVVVLDDSNDVIRKYTWGLDMSGQSGNPHASGIHGAGGIGGLLSAWDDTSESARLYWYFYDGNGNVTQVLEYDDTNDTLNTTPVARYEYGPYGNIVGPDSDSDGDWRDDAGTYAEANPFRFSTKWNDDELIAASQTGAIGEEGLYYYGYRYYSPRLGRWINRDPIGEQSASNLYLFVDNDPIRKIDALGEAVYVGLFEAAYAALAGGLEAYTLVDAFGGREVIPIKGASWGPLGGEAIEIRTAQFDYEEIFNDGPYDPILKMPYDPNRHVVAWANIEVYEYDFWSHNDKLLAEKRYFVPWELDSPYTRFGQDPENWDVPASEWPAITWECGGAAKITLQCNNKGEMYVKQTGKQVPESDCTYEIYTVMSLGIWVNERTPETAPRWKSHEETLWGPIESKVQKYKCVR